MGSLSLCIYGSYTHSFDLVLNDVDKVMMKIRVVSDEG